MNYDKFSTLLLRLISTSASSKNILFSPVSVAKILQVLELSVDGKSRTEIQNVIGLELWPDFNVDYADAVCLGREIWPWITRGYEKKLDQCGGRLFASENMVCDVNAWVRETTHGMINNVLSGPIDDRAAVLLNAVGFEAAWSDPFDDDQVRKGIFTNADGSKTQVDMLHCGEDIYLDEPTYTGFMKAYQGGALCFVGMLPRDKGPAGVKKVLESLSFTDWWSRAKSFSVDVSMPEFTTEFNVDLLPMLQSMGIRTAFATEADFTPMASVPLEVKSVQQKAAIEVNRRGTRAAAATWAEEVYGCDFLERKRKRVVLDRPFVYAIVDGNSCMPVFIGVEEHV